MAFVISSEESLSDDLATSAAPDLHLIDSQLRAAPSIPGGTPGTVHADGRPLADVQVTVYRAEERSHPVAFAISDSDGRFELRQVGSLEAVWLEPGNYHFTIESAGEFPMLWPPEYADADRTPLRNSWSSEDQEIELNVPEPRISH